MTTSGISRRDLFKFGGIAAAGAATLSLAGLAPESQPAYADETPKTFLDAPEPITDFADVKDFEIVVIGAGESGLSAVHTALEAGAHVACVQNVPMASTTGNMAAYIDLEANTDAEIQACVSFINWMSQYRSDRKLVESWAYNSQEALTWWREEAATGGVEAIVHDAVLPYNGYEIAVHANTYFHVEGNHGGAATVICDNLAAAGAEFFFSSPAVQLQKDGDRVTGVICENEDGTHTLYTASKGVIIACGDYTGNQEMLDYYAPETKGYPLFTTIRDGRALCAGMYAGAVMTPVNHTMMIHGDPAFRRLEMPFLYLDIHGNRFMDESASPRMGTMHNFMKPYMEEKNYEDPTACSLFSIVPENWKDYYEEWKAAKPYDISINNGGNEVDPERWIKADSPEELAEAIIAYAAENELTAFDADAATIVESINRYNEIVASGTDTDFGKNPMFLTPLEGTLYAVPRGPFRLPAILGGLIVDENQQCLDENHAPIPGLFAVGNASGQFYGGVDYPMDIEGLSIGRAITSGYVTGRYVASLDAEAVPETEAASESTDNKVDEAETAAPAKEDAAKEAPAEEKAGVDCAPCHGDSHKPGEENPHGY